MMNSEDSAQPGDDASQSPCIQIMDEGEIRKPFRAERPHRSNGRFRDARPQRQGNNTSRHQRVFHRRQNPSSPRSGGPRPARSNSYEETAPSRAYVPVGEPTELVGLLELTSKGFGFIRVPENNWAPSTEAVYVPADLISRYHLRPFVQVRGMAQKYERGHQLISITEVNGQLPEEAARNPHFDDLKAVYRNVTLPALLTWWRPSLAGSAGLSSRRRVRVKPLF